MKQSETPRHPSAPERYGNSSPPRDPGPPSDPGPPRDPGPPSDPCPPDRSYTEGRMGNGRNTGIRSLPGGITSPSTTRVNANDIAGPNGSDSSDPDLRVGAKGIMHQDIGESICRQPGNDCAS